MAQHAPITEKEVVDTMKAWQDAFEAGDPKFFNYFTKDMSMFALTTPTRIDGRETYEHGFAPFFLNRKRHSQILSPEVRLLGEGAAVMTFHNRILIEGVATNLRGTIVFERDDQSGTLKCVHMHNSPITQPIATSAATVHENRKLEDITLLEERVASASAMAGTPK
ncbi:MAG: nuclear transport factor 2 family protein [Deltaproteobacteria bacterium]|nr:nuclear transport factor 2 family protein [Deltaproteobacteria bacterium]